MKRLAINEAPAHAGDDERPTWRRTLPRGRGRDVDTPEPRASGAAAADRPAPTNPVSTPAPPPATRDPDLPATRPSDLCITRLMDGDEDVLLFSFAADRPPTSDGVTAAEREILKRLLAGDSNADIAAARGRSVRTVVNQVHSLFAKFGVRSRAAFVSAYVKGRRPR